jgi:hypothetical protein
MPDLLAGAVPVVGFTLRLYDVFEKFVRSVLRDSLAATSTDFPDNPADHQLFLDEDRRIRLLPDLGYRADRAWRFVGDVKYKADTGNGLNPTYTSCSPTPLPRNSAPPPSSTPTGHRPQGVTTFQTGARCCTFGT